MTGDRDPVVLVEAHDDDIWSVTINRPAARNALTAVVWTELEAALAYAESEAARAIVLSGAGGYFSAGGDLKTPPAGGSRAFAPVQRLQLAQRVLLRIGTLPIPVIAAVERGAVGLGWSLALACDLIVSAHDAVFATPFIERGVVPDGGAGWLLVRQMGRQRALDLLLSGARLSAPEAHALGLVAQLVPSGTAVDAAVALASVLPRGAGNVIELTKRLVRQAEVNGLAAYLEQELFAATLCQSGPEAAAARAAFAANRPDGPPSSGA